MPRQPGRPRKYDRQALLPEILPLIELGIPYRWIAAKLGTDESTFRYWLASDGSFSRAVREAEIRGIADALDQAKAGGKNWQGAAWWLERRYPSEFGRQDRTPIDVEKQLREYAQAQGLDADAVVREAQAILKG